jgi:serine protease Do
MFRVAMARGPLGRGPDKITINGINRSPSRSWQWSPNCRGFAVSAKQTPQTIISQEFRSFRGRIGSLIGHGRKSIKQQGVCLGVPMQCELKLDRSHGHPYRRKCVALSVAAVPAFAVMGSVTSAAAAPTYGCDSATVVAHALPAIVNITVVKVIRSTEAAPGKPNDTHFAVFVGSGAIVDRSGIIVTNKHVIQDAAVIRVTLQDRSQLPAQVMAVAGLVDLAVLKVTASGPLPTLPFANSDAVVIGQPAIAVGNPLGIGTSVSTGVVSALNRDLMRTPFDDFIQTDASINPGNSGGPLLDCAGKVIGINTALVSNNSMLGSIGLGFAMPANDVTFVLGMLRQPVFTAPNWVGLHLQDLTVQLATAFGRHSIDGAIVTGVDPDSPAANALLAPGDIITGILGEERPDSRAILRATLMVSSGDPILLSVWRHGHTREVTLRGQAWPHMMALRSQVLASPLDIARAEAVGLGLHLTSITATDRQRYSLGNASGVLIDQVAPGSQAETTNLQPGDVIQQVGELPSTTPEEVTDDLTQRESATGGLVALLVRSKSGPQWTTLWVGRIDANDLVAGPVQPDTSQQ